MAILDTVLGDQLDGNGLSPITPPASPPVPGFPLEEVLGDNLTGEVESPAPSFRSRVRGFVDRPAQSQGTWTDDYFEQIYVFPTSIAAGLVLATTVFDIDVFNAYRDEAITWTSYDDVTAGDGVSLGNPSPPPPDIVIPPLTSSAHDLTIDPAGPASISGTLEFDFEDPATNPVQVVIEITGTRSIVFPFRPDGEIEETLEFVSDVIRSRGGPAQVRSLRTVPRSSFSFRLLEDGRPRRLVNNILSDVQGRALGFPLWFEAVTNTVAIQATDQTITVEGTGTSQFRVGDLACVWRDEFTLESLQIDAIGANSITFASEFTTAFPVGSFVMPVADVILQSSIRTSRHVRNLGGYTIEMVRQDNGESLADITGWDTYQQTGGEERVFLHGDNLMEAPEIQESFERTLIVIDSKVGSPEVYSAEEISRRHTTKGFRTRSRADLWALRKLLHALRGPQVSWWLASEYPDFTLAANAASSDQAITVEGDGYVDNIASRPPRNVFRIVKSDGSTSDPKLITDATASGDDEILSISPDTLGIDANVADVERVELIERVRIRSDRVSIRHEDMAGKARCILPLETVPGDE